MRLTLLRSAAVRINHRRRQPKPPCVVSLRRREVLLPPEKENNAVDPAKPARSSRALGFAVRMRSFNIKSPAKAPAAS